MRYQYYTQQDGKTSLTNKGEALTRELLIVEEEYRLRSDVGFGCGYFIAALIMGVCLALLFLLKGPAAIIANLGPAQGLAAYVFIWLTSVLLALFLLLVPTALLLLVELDWARRAEIKAEAHLEASLKLFWANHEEFSDESYEVLATWEDSTPAKVIEWMLPVDHKAREHKYG